MTGIAIKPHRIITEIVSGLKVIAQRKDFSRLLGKMEKGDVLVITKLMMMNAVIITQPLSSM